MVEIILKDLIDLEVDAIMEELHRYSFETEDADFLPLAMTEKGKNKWNKPKSSKRREE